MKLSLSKIVSVVMLTLILSGLLIVIPVRGFPDDKPAIVVEPSLIKDPTKTPGSAFTVDVKIYNTTASNAPNGLQGLEFRLKWNNAILSLTSRASKLGQVGGVLNPSVLIGKDEVGADYYWLAGASMGSPWWGDGVAATINFQVVAVGKTGLDLVFTDLVDVDISPVDHYVQSGSFDNRLAVPTADVHVYPPNIINSSLTPCNTFNVSISITGASDLDYVSVNMSFDPLILEAIEAHWGWMSPDPTIDNVAGTVGGSSIISPPANGDLTLITVRFHVLELGESNLHLYGVELRDSFGDDLPFSLTDGYFNNMLITRIYVDPPFRMDPDLVPGSVTVFDIKAENFIDVETCEFDLLFNPAVIKTIGFLAEPIDGSLVDIEMTLDNELGTIHFRLTYDPSVNAAHAKIMNITFQIFGFGISPLDLNNTSLLDSVGNPLSHEAEDGLLITVIRDVAIVDIQPVPQKVYPGRPVTVYVTARNLGNLSETFTVSAYVDGGILLGTQLVTDLLPATNITLAFVWDTAGLPYCNWHELSANASFVPYEFDTTNNFMIGPTQVKIKIWGDINGDGSVNLIDLTLLAQAYNSVIGDPRYNPDADIDNNGKVGLTDLVSCAKYYNQSC
jgi:hypothetical protein